MYILIHLLCSLLAFHHLVEHPGQAFHGLIEMLAGHKPWFAFIAFSAFICSTPMNSILVRYVRIPAIYESSDSLNLSRSWASRWILSFVLK